MRIVFVCSGLIAASLLLAQEASRPKAGDAQTGAGFPHVQPAVTVRTVRAERVTLKRETTQPGTVHAFYEARLKAKVAGYLAELHVDIGDIVESGQVLAQIDVPHMIKTRERREAEEAKLRTDEERSRASLEVARAEIAAFEAAVQQSLADTKRAEAQLAADRSEFERIRRLAESGAVTERVRDEVRKRLDAAEADRAATEAATAFARANLLVAHARLRTAEADVKTAVARVVVAQKEVEELDALIAFATLRAPFRGVVTERNVDLGDFVRNAENSDSDALFLVAQVDKLRIRVAVPEHDAPWVDVGDVASFKSRVLVGKSIEGKVSRFSKSLDVRTRTMMVEIDLEGADHRLLPGMFGEVTITLDSRPDCLVLPAATVRYGEKGEHSHVYVVEADSKVRLVPVTTGLDDGHRIEIVEGLSSEEDVVTDMLGRLSPDQTVRVMEK